MFAKAVTPIMNVSSMQQSFDWFAKLGWRKGWDWGDPPGFGCVCSGDCEIFLCLNGQGGRGTESADMGIWMSVWVEDVDEVHQRCLEQGLEIVFGPHDMPWKVRELHIRHPDGHNFRISRGIE